MCLAIEATQGNSEKGKKLLKIINEKYDTVWKGMNFSGKFM